MKIREKVFPTHYFSHKTEFVMLIFILLSLIQIIKKGKEQCHTPDSPEGARVVAPRSPISPHHIHTMIPATTNRSSSVNRHNSSSPTNNGTPPPTSTTSSATTTLLASTTTSVHDSHRLLKIRRFLGALVQFGQDTNPDVGDRLRSLVLSLAVSFIRVIFIYLIFQFSLFSPAEWRLINRRVSNCCSGGNQFSITTKCFTIPALTFAIATA
jgi:hypothetical protein